MTDQEKQRLYALIEDITKQIELIEEQLRQMITAVKKTEASFPTVYEGYFPSENP